MDAPKSILVPVDFDERSGELLDYARMLADACGASLHLLHVESYPSQDSGEAARRQRETRERLEQLIGPADRVRRRATIDCVLGPPGYEIPRYAATHGIDLIVMATHSHGPSFQMATGSVAESVLGRAPCSVLAVKHREPDTDTSF
jgi:nucleotide-binding universal stress UspA family protein